MNITSNTHTNPMKNTIFDILPLITAQHEILFEIIFLHTRCSLNRMQPETDSPQHPLAYIYIP